MEHVSGVSGNLWPFVLMQNVKSTCEEVLLLVKFQAVSLHLNLALLCSCFYWCVTRLMVFSCFLDFQYREVMAALESS